MNRLVPPSIVIAIAVAGWLGAVHAGRRDPQVLSIPFDRRAGAVMTSTFRAGHDAVYDVGLTLDRPAADRAFPCAFSAAPPNACKDDVPLDLTATVSADGRTLARGRYPGETRVMRGSGRETLTIVAAATPKLVRGRTYRVEVRSAIATEGLTAARPRLTVTAQMIDLKSEMILRSVAATAAGVVGVVGLVWLAIAALLNRRYALSR